MNSNGPSSITSTEIKFTDSMKVMNEQGKEIELITIQFNCIEDGYEYIYAGKVVMVGKKAIEDTRYWV